MVSAPGSLLIQKGLDEQTYGPKIAILRIGEETSSGQLGLKIYKPSGAWFQPPEIPSSHALFPGATPYEHDQLAEKTCAI
jgi:hypothetical protein